MDASEMCYEVGNLMWDHTLFSVCQHLGNEAVLVFGLIHDETRDLIKREYTVRYDDLEDIMNIFKMTDRFDEIKGIMLEKPVDMTIAKVWRNKTKRNGQTFFEAMITFEGNDKPLTLNAPCVKSLVTMFGADTDKWIGKKVTLYSEEGNWFGKDHNVVRIKVVQ